MKRTITLLTLMLSLTAITGCTDKHNSATAEKTKDADKTRAEVREISEKFHTAYKAKQIETIKGMLLDNGSYSDTDHTEIFSYEPFIQHLNRKLLNPAIGTIQYKVDFQEIIFNTDMDEATIIEQFNINIFTQYIPWRMVSHVVWKDNTWKYDIISFSLTPSNDVLPAVNMAAKQE